MCGGDYNNQPCADPLAGLGRSGKGSGALVGLHLGQNTTTTGEDLAIAHISSAGNVDASVGKDLASAIFERSDTKNAAEADDGEDFDLQLGKRQPDGSLLDGSLKDKVCG